MCGTPLAMSLKVAAPNSRFRTISGVQRSARISEARATGQYCRYVVTVTASRSRPAVSSSVFALDRSRRQPDHRRMARTSSDQGQVSTTAAEIYDEFFVPALFARWTDAMLAAAGVTRGDRVIDIGCGTGVLARAAEPRVGPMGEG